MMQQQALAPRGERTIAVARHMRDEFSRLPQITADNLQETLLAEHRPALVLCGASWAAPCRAQSRELFALAQNDTHRFAVYGLDVLREEELAAWVQVRCLPTTLLFRHRQIVQRFTGFHSIERLSSAFVAAEAPRLAR
jgi:thioredoxin-like negative regulator of GroEL